VPNAAQRWYLLSCHVMASRGTSPTALPDSTALPPIGTMMPPRQRMFDESNQ
jgi:hypothetical protein